MKRVQAIYEPKGRAREYAPLACNLYEGCKHACTYCFAPTLLKRFGRIEKRETFFRKAGPREGVLEQLRLDAEKLKGQAVGPVLLCFTCDPYQMLEHKHRFTRQAIEILGHNGIRARILTKAGTAAMEDLELFRKYNSDVGVTIAFMEEKLRKIHEPAAGWIHQRVALLRACKGIGVSTWVSIEPVIAPAAALDVIASTHKWVDVYRVGKINHDKQKEDAVNWSQFLRDVLSRLDRLGNDYVIKEDLWVYADSGTKARWPKLKLGENHHGQAENTNGQECEGSAGRGKSSRAEQPAKA